MSDSKGVLQSARGMLRLAGSKIYLMATAAFLGTLLEGISISVFIPVLLSFMAGENGIPLPKYLEPIAHWPVFTHQTTTLVCMIGLFLAKAVADYWRYLVLNQCGIEIGEKVKFQAVHALGGASYRRFMAFKSGQLQSFFTSELNEFINGFSRISQVMAMAVSLVVLMVASVFLSLRFTLIAMAVAVCIGVLFRFTNRRVVRASRIYADSALEYQASLGQLVGNYKYLLSTGRFSDLKKKVLQALSRLTGQHKSMTVQSGLMYSIQEPVAVISLIGLVYVEVHVFKTNLTSLVASLLIFFRIFKSISMLQLSWQAFISRVGNVEFVLRTLKEVQSGSEVSTQSFEPVHFREKIELKGISVEVEGKKILDRINVTIPKNSFVAVVGESGSGKTTLIDVLTGLVRPSEGVILIDGQPQDLSTSTYWRSHLGLVIQDPPTFPGTIHENISFYDHDISEKKKQLARDSARTAGAASFIESRLSGYESMIGDRGMNLSGGQRQRLAIARELYRRPELILLDEATSALDAENERYVNESLSGLKGKVTIVTVTHRLMNTVKADRIYVLEHGRLVEEGSFSDLKSRSASVFSKLLARSLDEPVPNGIEI